MASDSYNRYHENKQHGKTHFPFAIYYGRIPDMFTSYPLHWHEEIEIIYVLRGKGIVTLNGTAAEAGEGDLFFFMPGDLHAMSQYNQHSFSYFNIIFNLRLLMNDDQTDYCSQVYLKQYEEHRFRIPLRISTGHPQYLNLLRCLTPILERRLIMGNGMELFIKGQLFLLFYYLEGLKIDNPLSSDKILYVDKMKKILRFLEHHYMEPLTVSQAADLCSFSPSYFMKFFKAFTGTSYIQYVNQYRLEQAAWRLLHTNLSVLNISEECGFENHSYFIRSFKKKYGTTPLAYRKAGEASAQNPAGSSAFPHI